MKGSKKPLGAITALPLMSLGVSLALGQCPQALAQPDIKKQGAGENPRPGLADPRPDAGRNPKLLGERKMVDGRPNAEIYRNGMDERGQ